MDFSTRDHEFLFFDSCIDHVKKGYLGGGRDKVEEIGIGTVQLPAITTNRKGERLDCI